MYFYALSQRVPSVESMPQPETSVDEASSEALSLFHELYNPEGERNHWGEDGIAMLAAWQHFGRGYLAAKGWIVNDRDGKWFYHA